MTQFSLADLEKIVAERGRSGDAGSWTAKLFAGGMERAWRLARRPGRPLMTREAVQLLASGPPVPISRARSELGYDPVPYDRGLAAVARYLEGRS